MSTSIIHPRRSVSDVVLSSIMSPEETGRKCIPRRLYVDEDDPVSVELFKQRHGRLPTPPSTPPTPVLLRSNADAAAQFLADVEASLKKKEDAEIIDLTSEQDAADEDELMEEQDEEDVDMIIFVTQATFRNAGCLSCGTKHSFRKLKEVDRSCLLANRYLFDDERYANDPSVQHIKRGCKNTKHVDSDIV